MNEQKCKGFIDIKHYTKNRNGYRNAYYIYITKQRLQFKRNPNSNNAVVSEYDLAKIRQQSREINNKQIGEKPSLQKQFSEKTCPKSGTNGKENTRNVSKSSVKVVKSANAKRRDLKDKESSSKKSKKRSGMTYAQKKRASFNYRNEYFKKNPGIYGKIWFCSQCGKILIGKNNVVIDHIVPLNNVAGVNRTFNTVATCRKCNSKKSDIVDYRVIKGYLAKIFEVITSHLPDTIALFISLMVSFIYQILNIVILILTMPFTFANGMGFIYLIVVLFIFLVFYFNIR